MFEPTFFATALVTQRHKELMAQAEEYRQLKQARRARRSWTGSRARRAANGRAGLPAVGLADGSTVIVRPVEASDAPLLAEGFERLSAQSRQSRFLYRKPSLSSAELRYFTDVDHHDHEALAALSSDGRGVGVARFIRDRCDSATADVAVTVIDDWQRRGVGTELLRRLVKRAEVEGIRQFTALVADDNAATVGLLAKTGLDVEVVGRDVNALEYVIRLRG